MTLLYAFPEHPVSRHVQSMSMYQCIKESRVESSLHKVTVGESKLNMAVAGAWLQ